MRRERACAEANGGERMTSKGAKIKIKKKRKKRFEIKSSSFNEPTETASRLVAALLSSAVLF